MDTGRSQCEGSEVQSTYNNRLHAPKPNRMGESHGCGETGEIMGSSGVTVRARLVMLSVPHDGSSRVRVMDEKLVPSQA